MLENIIKGGPLMIPLMICSVLALAVVLDRLFAFRANNRIDTRALRAEVLTLIDEDRVDDAITLCGNTPGPVAAVLLVGIETYEKLLAAGHPPESLRMVIGKSMEDYYSHAMSAVEKRFNILTAVGNSAPLFGMAGTVTGMIKSFGELAKASGLGAGPVAAGISEALVTTAAGLLIALGAVIPYNFFNTAAERVGLEIEEATTELVEHVAMMHESARFSQRVPAPVATASAAGEMG